jgi:pimeloyl-ACP methyl ester carboxylesterase
VDGSGWQAVYNLLTQDGYNVAVVQNPTLSLAGDAEATRQIIDAQDRPVVLVGHSYGGAVVAEAGNHDNLAALVYIAAFAPDTGESVNTLIGTFPQDGPQPFPSPPSDPGAGGRARAPGFQHGRHNAPTEGTLHVPRAEQNALGPGGTWVVMSGKTSGCHLR